jgi:hypothetical protein
LQLPEQVQASHNPGGMAIEFRCENGFESKPICEAARMILLLADAKRTSSIIFNED